MRGAADCWRPRNAAISMENIIAVLSTMIVTKLEEIQLLGAPSFAE